MHIVLPPASAPHYPVRPDSTTLVVFWRTRTTSPPIVTGDSQVESHGTLGTIWASFGMTAYYMALTWINILLGLFLSPLFVIPMTWLKQKQGGFKA